MCYENNDNSGNNANDVKGELAEIVSSANLPKHNSAPSALDSQILALHNAGCSEEEIAGEVNLDVVAVKYSLLRSSVDYRKENNKIKQKNITDEEVSEFYESYKNLARGTENEYLKEKTLRWLIEDAKGYHDNKRNILPLNGGVNLIVLNNSLKELKTRRVGALPTIDIENTA